MYYGTFLGCFEGIVFKVMEKLFKMIMRVAKAGFKMRTCLLFGIYEQANEIEFYFTFKITFRSFLTGCKGTLFMALW